MWRRATGHGGAAGRFTRPTCSVTLKADAVSAATSDATTASGEAATPACTMEGSSLRQQRR